MNRSYRLALMCWGIPLVAGLAVFVAWLISGHDGWEMAGINLIAVGSVLFLVGVASLIVSIRKDRREGVVPSRRLWFTSLVCAGLLFSNFPVALALMLGAIRIETRYTVVVQNDSTELWEEVGLVGGGIRSATVSLPPGGTTTFEVWPKTDGSLRLQARRRAREYSVVVEGYVTSGLGGDAIVTFHLDGRTTVEHEFRDSGEHRLTRSSTWQPLAESTHARSGRTAWIDAEFDTVWLYLLNDDRSGIEAASWLFNLVEAPRVISQLERERAVPLPVTAQSAGPGSRCSSPELVEWTILWDSDGAAVAAFADGECVGFITAEAQCFSRHLLAESSWGSPWSEAQYYELFED